MGSDLDKSGEGAETVEQKLDALSASVDQRFDAVDVALIEQRQYTEFAFDRLADELRSEMRAGFNGVESRLNSIDGRFNGVDSRLNSIDSRFNRLERKLDQFIDTQSTANQLMERRLTALEARSDQE